MDLTALGRLLAPYRASFRTPLTSLVERGYGNDHTARVAADVANLSNLSLESKVSLSQKAHVAPPPPPSETRRKPTLARGKGESKQLLTQDFTGRTCSGSLHGPLLMEDTVPATYSESPKSRFSTDDFALDNPADFAPLRSACVALAELEPSVLQTPFSSAPLARIPSGDSTFAYFGVQQGMAVIVQEFENPGSAPSNLETSQIRLPNGQVALIARGQDLGGHLSLYLPASSLDDLASWGRSHLAEA